jgi:DNA-binding winged helix-turn-helix (wHTH) protein/tetratricopeptide (TPR) repeat protein
MGRRQALDGVGDCVSEGRVFEFGPYRLDTSKCVLWRDRELVKLSPKALDVLVVLVKAQGDVVRKEDLMAEVWPETFVEEANLSVNVSALRKALGDREDGQPYIVTVPRRGYRFVAGAAPAARSVATVSRPSLAVLPFGKLGGAGGEDYLGLAMADALIARLSRLADLTVRPTRAVLAYADTACDPREAGRELSVDAVVDGTIQRQGGRLRVTVQLVPLVETLPAWGETFDLEFTDLFAVQDALAERVARSLALKLAGSERPSLPQGRTASLEAYQAYVKGRYFWSRLTAEGIGKALELYQQAALDDPSYALPHAGLADAYLVLGFSGVVPPRDAWALAEEAARRALGLEETVADAHVSLGYVELFQDWDWAAAEEHLARAVDLLPSSPATRQWHALYLDMRGRFEEALEAILLAQQLDPLSLTVSTMLGFQYTLTRRYEEEKDQYRRTVELDPNHFLGHWGLGLAHEHLGQPREAVREHEKALELSANSSFMKAVLARTRALAGETRQARELLEELEDASRGGYASSYQRATVCLALGEAERALDALEAAAEERDPWLVWLRVDPMLDPLRTAPRLEALLLRIFPSSA